MRKLANDEALRVRMGKAARERIKDSSPDRWAADFEAAIEKILQERNPSTEISG
jgi:hypothetical protein